MTPWPRSSGATSISCLSTASSTSSVEVIRRIKANPTTADVPVMLITNYPDHQDAAEALGAIRGFGKLEFNKPETLACLQPILG
jgi:CheY-like chemotaxis protein